MFYKTINEWRTNVKPINEGGGAGINFKADVDSTTGLKVFKTGEKFELSVIYQTNMCEKFDAEGYDDGMNNVKGSLIAWTPGVIPLDTVLDMVVENSDDIDGLDKNLTVRQIFEKSEKTIAYIDIRIQATYKLENTLYGGWVRGNLAAGDVIFKPAEQRNGLDIKSETIDLKVNYEDGSTDESYNYDIMADEILLKNAPTGVGAEGINDFYLDVFRYDSTADAKYCAYQNLMEGEYDNILKEYMEDNDITADIKDYKESLKNDDEELPDELYSLIQDRVDVVFSTYDAHSDDNVINYGV